MTTAEVRQNLQLYQAHEVFRSAEPIERGKLDASVMTELKGQHILRPYAHFWNDEESQAALEKVSPAMVAASTYVASLCKGMTPELRAGVFSNRWVLDGDQGGVFHIDSDNGLTRVMPVTITLCVVGPETDVIIGDAQWVPGNPQRIIPVGDGRVEKLTEGIVYELGPTAVHAEPPTTDENVTRYLWRVSELGEVA